MALMILRATLKPLTCSPLGASASIHAPMAEHKAVTLAAIAHI